MSAERNDLTRPTPLTVARSPAQSGAGPPLDVSRLRQQAVEEASSAFLIADAQEPDMPIVDINPAFTDLTGYEPEDVLGHNCRFLQGPDTDPAAVNSLSAAITSGQPKVVTLLNYRADGAPFWNEITISPLYDGESRIRYFVGIQHDVTDRVESARLGAEHAAEQERERLSSAMLQTLRHELKSPLSIICGYTELLLDARTAPLTDEQAADLATILGSGQQLDRLLTAMLDLAQLQAGALPLMREEMVLTRLLTRLQGEFAPRAAAKSLELQFEAPALLPPVCGDAVRLHQALTHLLDNAVRFTDHGQVSLTATESTDHLVIVIADSGRGMEPEVLRQLFHGMQTGELSLCREFGGLGIGGALAAGIVKAHGGMIAAESNPGSGTQVSIRLPVSTGVCGAQPAP